MSGLSDKKMNGATDTGSMIDDAINALIDFLITGFNILAGVVTFTNHPITPSSAPTTDYQVANKKYVDDSISAIPAPVGFGDWESRNIDTIYHATTDGIVSAYCSPNAMSPVIIGYTDSNASPTTIKVANSAYGLVPNYAGFSMPVKKGNYYKVTTTDTGTTTYSWIPLGA